MTRPAIPRRRTTLFSRLPLPERAAVGAALRSETVGGLVLLAAALVALVWANSPLAGVYQAVRDFRFGLPVPGLELSVQQWASEGLLTIFFLVAGIELKRELVVGELRFPAAAAVPVVAAVCGMAVPAALYAVTAAAGGGSLAGWAVPMATDIAFALAVLAVVGTHLPAALRAFLLTLAVVDDLGAIVIIAIFFSGHLNAPALLGAVAGLAAFGLLQHFGVRGWWWYVPLAAAIWTLTQIGGIHATAAGVAMGLLLRITPAKEDRQEAGQAQTGERQAHASPGERTEHLLRPISAAIAVPLFALFAAGVSISPTALTEVFTHPEPLGVIIGLVAGKTAGVLGGAYLAARLTRARLDPSLTWADIFGVATLAGIGFTIALLLGELSFPQPTDSERIKTAVLISSLLAATLATLVLKRRNHIYRSLNQEEERQLGSNSGA